MPDDSLDVELPDNSLRVELIKHLSSEIESCTTFQHTLRSRMAFSVLVGPFLVLGSFIVAAAKIQLTWPKEPCTWVWLYLAVVCYVGLGIYGAKLDKFLTVQCDFFRGELLSVARGKHLGRISLEFPEKIGSNFLKAYLPGFLIVVATFALLITFFLLLPHSPPQS